MDFVKKFLKSGWTKVSFVSLLFVVFIVANNYHGDGWFLYGGTTVAEAKEKANDVPLASILSADGVEKMLDEYTAQLYSDESETRRLGALGLIKLGEASVARMILLLDTKYRWYASAILCNIEGDKIKKALLKAAASINETVSDNASFILGMRANKSRWMMATQCPKGKGPVVVPDTPDSTDFRATRSPSTTATPTKSTCVTVLGTLSPATGPRLMYFTHRQGVDVPNETLLVVAQTSTE